jgi:hypothetical protein
MPITITCPHCSQPLTVNESPVPDTIACPHCSKHVAIPAVGVVPAADAAAVTVSGLQPEKPDQTQQIGKNREPMSRHSWFFIAIGVMIAVVVCIFIYDRTESYFSRKKLDRIREEEYYMMMQTRRLGPGDTDHKRIVERLRELEEEEEVILTRHPEWRP